MTTAYRPDVPPSDPGADGPVRLKARRPADLLAAVPFLLGFHPEESLVALFLQAGRVLLTARYDLGAPAERDPAELDPTDLDPAGLDPADLDVAGLVARHQPTGLVLVAYSADAERGRVALRAQADQLAGVEIVDLLLVDGRRWWSLVCTAGCCPAEGSPYVPGEHPLSAEAVFAGLVARPDRASVVATVAGPAAQDWSRLRRRAQRVRARLRSSGRTERQDALGRAVVEALPRLDPDAGSDSDIDGRAGAGLDDDACLELAVLLRDVLVRDVACALVTREDAHRHLALWQEVLSRTPPELAPAPLCLVGIAAWASGNGTLLNACCARLSELDPAYPMGRLLSDVSRRALPPAWWDAMADGLRRDLGLEG